MMFIKSARYGYGGLWMRLESFACDFGRDHPILAPNRFLGSLRIYRTKYAILEKTFREGI